MNMDLSIKSEPLIGKYGEKRPHTRSINTDTMEAGALIPYPHRSDKVDPQKQGGMNVVEMSDHKLLTRPQL
ncbi:hypothetical protein Leryth_027472 [Lithospermum erythrorhizon]|nr:hypothetical protein Leryth_027472 [Lithospermum erythrorhizon]